MRIKLKRKKALKAALSSHTRQGTCREGGNLHHENLHTGGSTNRAGAGAGTRHVREVQGRFFFKYLYYVYAMTDSLAVFLRLLLQWEASRCNNNLISIKLDMGREIYSDDRFPAPRCYELMVRLRRQLSSVRSMIASLLGNMWKYVACGRRALLHAT
jgi:hypothetical protein